MEKLNNILFYSLEKAIKSYRQFAQRSLVQNGFDVTIDQWLVLKAVSDNPAWTQQQIAEITFKDYASVTRIIDLLVKKRYLSRIIHEQDRRRFNLTPTESAAKILIAMQPVIESNRKVALKGITTEQASQLQHILNAIIQNCKL